MQVIVMVMVFAAGYGFNQALGWGFITIIFAMAGMLFIPLILTNAFLHPATRARFDNDKRYITGFLICQSILAFAVFQAPDAMQRAETDMARYAAIWWFIIPHCCIALLLFDRVFDAFGAKRMIPKDGPLPPVEPRWPFDSKPDGKSEIKFDPKRFR
jgi:hypothetical protein